MNWPALLQYQCPKCGSKLNSEGLLDTKLFCSAPFCDFKIGEAKMNEILKNLSKKNGRNYDPDKNLSELNNMDL